MPELDDMPERYSRVWPGSPAARAAAASEVERLRAALEQIRDMHHQANDDPGGPPYCPECVAYDGNPDPCPTSEIARKALLGEDR